MKKILFGLMALLMSVTLWAAPRTAEEAAEIAASFVNERPALRKAHAHRQTASSMRLAHARQKTASADNAFYVFNRADNAGFIIVSADDRTAEDVLGYSDGGADFALETINPNLRFWLDRYAEEISAIDQDAEAAAQPRKAKQVTAIAPLLKNADGVEITWYQLTPYNNLCPMDVRDNTRCYTGCVATAASQIMYKWRYPAQGTGSHSYTWYDCKNNNCSNYTTTQLSANYGATTYDWDNMLPAYEDVSYTAAQATAVATLMHHVGVACEMQYGGEANNGSGAWTDDACYGLATYFGYEYDKFISMYSKSGYQTAKQASVANVTYEFSVTTAQITSYFNNDLEAGRPIIMGGEDSDGGHEFVCDGRDASNKFHINWGWEGQSNGYFAITALKPTGTSYNFSSNLDAIIGLRPAVQGEDVNVTWMADGVQFDQTVAAHGVLSLPTATPDDCANGRVFMGWTADADYSADVAPTYVKAGTFLDADATFYAVYAVAEQGTGSTEETMVFANQGFENGEDVSSVDMPNCTLLFAKAQGTNAPKYYDSGAAIRCYKNNTLTISSENTITGIVVTTVSGYEGVIEASTGTYNSGTWTGSANQVVLTNAPTDNAQWRIVSIKVTTGGGTSYSAYSTTCSGAVPEPVYYTIRFFDAGIQIGETQSVLKNQQAQAPADPTPACEDYTFAGWWTAPLAADNTEGMAWVTNFKATKDQDYYAIYSKTVTSGGGASQPVEESLTFSSLGKANQTDVNKEEIAIGANSTITFYNGTNTTTPKYYDTGNAIRLYGGGYCVVSSSAANISQIVFTFGSGDNTNEITADKGTYKNGTWTGDAASVTFTVGSSSGHRRFAGVAVTLGSGATSTTYYSSAVDCTPSAIVDVTSEEAAQKILRNGQVFILRNGQMFTVTGQRVE